MCLLLETIQIRNGEPMHTEYHHWRFNTSRKECFGLSDEISLVDLIRVPHDMQQGILRCRIVYGPEDISIEYVPYHFREIRSLKLVNAGDTDYRLKYADRSRLKELFEQRGTCDDIIMVKDGLLTDSFAANLVFFDGHRWYTPDTPLLAGTQRARLLDSGDITEARITTENFREFHKVGLINAFCDLENMPVTLSDKIVW